VVRSSAASDVYKRQVKIETILELENVKSITKIQ
jgi:hypothetical protein